MRGKNPETPDFLTKKDWRFRELNGCIESTYINLRKQGIGTEVKHTPIITMEEENQLWERGVSGTETPTKLQRSVFFMLARFFVFVGVRSSET